MDKERVFGGDNCVFLQVYYKGDISADDNLFFIVMHPLPSDTVYAHLRGRGLILSPISRVEIPKPPEPTQSFMSVLSSFLPKK